MNALIGGPANGNGVEEMTLRLHPEELGHITLKVKQSGGDLFIDMRVDNPLAKQMVESGFDLHILINKKNCSFEVPLQSL